MAGGISIHAVDIAFGRPAAGMRLDLLHLDETTSKPLLQSACTDTAGMIAVENQLAGQFQARFYVGEYLRANGYEKEVFQEIITFPFGIDQPARHHHLPLKFTPFGMSLFLTH